MAKQKVFFSYSRADGSAFAARLAVDLEKKGIDVWIDQEDIKAGSNWDKEIEKALESCDCVLFLETKKSVTSTHVLDEVYFALEQKKRVIPLIFVDSKTPFRLQRLQHIDFTKDYKSGFDQLMHELEGNSQTVANMSEDRSYTKSKQPFFSYGFTKLMLFGCLTAVLIATFVLTTKNKGTASEGTQGTLVLADTSKNNTYESASVQEISTITTENQKPKKAEENDLHVKRKGNERGIIAPAGRINPNTGPAQSLTSKAEDPFRNFNQTIAGNWRLIKVEPNTKAHSGYLKIDALGENNVAIKTYTQFYYFDSDASSSPTIFNAFAGCSSCAATKEMNLHVEDIAIGSRTIKKLQEDQPDGRKAGDVILDANYNKSIGGTVILKFIDNNNAYIKIKQPLTIALSDELMLEPFVYTFYFKKRD